MMLLFGTEIYCLIVGLVFLCLSMTRADARRDYAVALTLGGLGVIVGLASVNSAGMLFHETYRVDLFSQVVKNILLGGYFLIICICPNLKGLDDERHGEFYMLLTVCTLSMMLLVSSVHLLTIYVALELSSYSLYVLVVLRSDRGYSIKTGLRYFLIGASAAAVMLFGMALLYGAVRTAYLFEMIQVLPGVIHRPEVVIGLFLTLCGFFFKLAVFPFHFWAPDVYEGAPNQVAAYVSTVSKVAAIAVLVRMAAVINGGSEILIHALVFLSILSMTVGNLSAITQQDLKRLLAFSSVAHAGYVLIGILSMSAAGHTSAVFYAFVVLTLKFTCFLVVIQVAGNGGNLRVSDLAGLHKRSPLLALALMMALFGLAGIPPTIGFTGKLLIFQAAVQAGHFSLIIIAMINVVISLYYYLLVLRAAYLLDPEPGQETLAVSPPVKALTYLLVAVTVIAGFYPRYLIDIAQAAAGAVM